jgi:hypothetical protein
MDPPPTSLVTARTNLPALSAVAAFDACFHTRSPDLTHWTVNTSTGGLRLSENRRSDGADPPSATRQLDGDLGVGRGQVVPVEVELIESRRRCLVVVRPSAPAGRSAAGPRQAAYVRAANEAAAALAAALEATVQQWVVTIDEHAAQGVTDHGAGPADARR